jgi:acyl carrier protein
MDELLGGTAGRIQKVLAESVRANVPAEEDVGYEQRMDEAASLDSIAVLEFVAAVEKEFGIEMEAKFLEFDFLRDLPALAAYIEERKNRG